MRKTLTIVLATLAIVIIGGVFALANFGAKPKSTQKPIEKINTNFTKMSEEQAKLIAQKTCVKGSETINTGMYNEITKTWWFDANFNSTKEGCNPACVVSEETKTAEINWRCTGLLKDNK